jgi:hypothetical protein
MNRAHTEPISEDRLSKNFEACWDGLEAAIGGIDIGGNAEDGQAAAQEQHELGEKQVEILMLLVRYKDDELQAEQIEYSIGENATTTRHHIDLLRNEDYIYEILDMNNGNRFGIDDRGREYLVEHGLV